MPQTFLIHIHYSTLTGKSTNFRVVISLSVEVNTPLIGINITRVASRRGATFVRLCDNKFKLFVNLSTLDTGYSKKAGTLNTLSLLLILACPVA